MAFPRQSAVNRSMFDGVLDVMRRLGGCTGLDEALKVIVDAVVDVLGFGAASINVTTPEGDLRVEAVVGPPDIHELIGLRTPMSFWQEFLVAAEPWGELRYFSHERDQTLPNSYPSWTPTQPATDAPDAWHPDDELFAPLWDENRQLAGVLSVDLPMTGRRPDLEQRMVLEVFAGQAAKAIRDAQAQERADVARHEVETLWRTAFEHTPTGVALIDTRGRFVQVNEAVASFLGYDRERLLTMSYADVVHPDDRADAAERLAELVDGTRSTYRVEKRYVRSDSTIVDGWTHVGVIRDEQGSVHTIVGQITDITERRLAERRLAHRLTHDELTGLPNRVSVDELLSRHLAARESVAVLFCDVDRFKTINDSLGRTVGDEVLQAVSQRLRDSLPDCAVGRVGDDEFVVVESVPGPDAAATARALGDRLLMAMRVPVAAAGVRLTVSVCVGAATSVAGAHQHADELLADAEQAMRRAKRHGRNRVELYDPERDHSGTRQDLELEQALRLAIITGEGLELYLQPIVNVADESLIGGEALVRWNHPQRGLLAPTDFLPIAEHSGLMSELGDRILVLGARAAAMSDGWVAVNVSGSQLGRGTLPAAVRRALADNGVSPERLQLEITETVLVDASLAAVRELHEIADLGVIIALDDFGTGFSSLSLLRDLPISVVKIDKTFTGPISGNLRTAALVRSLVSMCNALAIKTVAEGIETSEQFALVRALGCDHAQGFLFGEPKPYLGA